MKFEIVRSLKNKVFSTSLVRVEDEDPICVLTEKQLEDDFGPVVVDAGGKFDAYIHRDAATNKIIAELDPADTADKVLFKFAVDPKKIELLQKVELKFEADSLKESPRKDALDKIISPLEVSQVKCEIFEATMKDRIEKAIEVWKGQTTTFETEDVPAFEVHLS